jgi:hypothetical protein
MAPPVTYLQDGVQYITLMVGWGGAAALANTPGGGPIKRSYGSVLTFSVGANSANTKLEVPPFGQTGPPTVAVHMKASPAPIHEGNKGTAPAVVKTQRAFAGLVRPGKPVTCLFGAVRPAKLHEGSREQR